MKYRGWIVLSGLVWLMIGGSLLYKGLDFIADGILEKDSFVSRFENKENVATFLIAFALIIGFFKGRFVLSKTVKRIVARIISLPLPIRIKDVYPRGYYFLIFGMMGLGMSFRFLPIPIDLRGMIDIAIGSALIHGAILYFRSYDKSYLFESPSPDKVAPTKSDASFDA